MAHPDFTDSHQALTGSQAASLLTQGRLGAVLVRRAETLAAKARQEHFGHPDDQAARLRRAVAAPMRLIPPVDPSGDAA
ncbi:MAG TPA: hypothetical protein ENJ00_01895 [Phycisphaerales bacterium]|nr:hypothetical protein [Phycisphaerales bacterium]